MTCYNYNLFIYFIIAYKYKCMQIIKTLLFVEHTIDNYLYLRLNYYTYIFYRLYLSYFRMQNNIIKLKFVPRNIFQIWFWKKKVSRYRISIMKLKENNVIYITLIIYINMVNVLKITISLYEMKVLFFFLNRPDIFKNIS